MDVSFGTQKGRSRRFWLFDVAPTVPLFVLLLPTGICSSAPVPAFVATPDPHTPRTESLLSSIKGVTYHPMERQGSLLHCARARRASACPSLHAQLASRLSANVNGPAIFASRAVIGDGSGCCAGTLARLAAGVVLPSAAPRVGIGNGIGIASSAASLLHANHWYVWAMLLASSSAGLWSERTRWGAAVSSPLVTMLLTIGLCNAGILPASSPVYATVNQVFVPLAVPLLLFDADLRRVLRYAGTLLACFVIGAAGTVIGTVAAALTVPLVGLGSGDGWKIASALAARHIGGAVNYVAVCETLGVSADAVVAGLAADNMVVSLYFIFLFWITKPDPPKAPTSRVPPSKPKNACQDNEPLVGDGDSGDLEETSLLLSISKETMSYALTAAFGLCLVGDLMSKVGFGGRISAIPLVTLVTVAGATAAPSVVGRLGSVGAQLGVLFMQLFFAVTGAQGSLAVVLGTAPSLLIFSIVQIAVHFGFLVGLGRLVRLPFRELALASNANVGGPTTAAAMAAAKGWKNLVLPALLTGVLGYATATFIGVGMGHALLRSLVAGA